MPNSASTFLVAMRSTMPSCGSGNACAINQSGSEVVLDRYIVYKENDAPFCLDVLGVRLNAFNDAPFLDVPVASCGNACAINKSGSEVVLERYIVYKENDAPFCLDVPGGNAFNDAFLWLLRNCKENVQSTTSSGNVSAINQSEVVLERYIVYKENDAPFCLPRRSWWQCVQR